MSLKTAPTKFIHIMVLGSVYTDREPERVFSSWNSLIICRITVQIVCEHLFFRANDRIDCPQSEFCQMFARFLLLTNQQVLPLHYFYK